LSFLSYKIAESNKEKPLKVVVEHLVIAVIVLVVTYYIGVFVGGFLGEWLIFKTINFKNNDFLGF